MKKLLFCSAAVVLIATGNAQTVHAELGQHRLDMYAMGAGLISCAEFTDKLQGSGGREISETAFAWAQGFMSGMNGTLMTTTHKSKNINAVSTDDQQRQFDAYCEQHPDQKYYSGVTDFFASLPDISLPNQQ